MKWHLRSILYKNVKFSPVPRENPEAPTTYALNKLLCLNNTVVKDIHIILNSIGSMMNGCPYMME